MACNLCRGTLVPIEVPTADTAFQCLVCGTVDTAEQMMARALRKAIRIASAVDEPDLAGPTEGNTRKAEDSQAVQAFLKSLEIDRQI